jgi:hypothetical protein
MSEASRWIVVGYHDRTGHRTVMPITWPTKERAEEVREFTQRLASPGFRAANIALLPELLRNREGEG